VFILEDRETGRADNRSSVTHSPVKCKRRLPGPKFPENVMICVYLPVYASHFAFRKLVKIELKHVTLFESGKYKL
jgi:hypothetical protein